MLKPKWVSYSGPNTDIKNAVKISDTSEETVLVARSKVKEEDCGSVWRLGEFVAGKKYATVLSKWFRQVEDFEILIAPEGYFQWVRCYGGYVPKFAVCSGTSDLHDEPMFLGRKCMIDDVEDQNEQMKSYSVGIVMPSHQRCFCPISRNGVGNKAYRRLGGHELSGKKEGHYKYEVLQVVSQDGHGKDGLPGLVFERMGEEQVLDRLTKLFQLHFHETKQETFHKEISKLWATSGLDTDFFLPKALPRLLDLAQIYGLPTCFLQCVKQLLMTRELSTEESIRDAIKLARLYKYSCSKGFTGKLTAQPESGFVAYKESEDFEPLVRHFKQLQVNQEGTPGQSALTELMYHIQPSSGEREHLIGRQQSIPAAKSQRGQTNLSEEEKRTERTRQKSLLSSFRRTRAPIPHSVMIQRQVDETEATVFGVNLENDQVPPSMDAPKILSTLELEECRKQVEQLIQVDSCTHQVSAVIQMLLPACQRHAALCETGQVSSMRNLTEWNQTMDSETQVATPDRIFSSLFTSGLTRGATSSSTINAHLYSLLDQYVTYELGGAWTPTRMLEVVVVSERFNAKIPNEMKKFLAKSFILSLNRMSDDTTLLATVEQRIFHFLVAEATSESGLSLLPALIWVLTYSPTTEDQLDSKLFETLTGFLKNMDEEQFLKDYSVVPSIQRLIGQKCRTYSNLGTIEITAKYLGSGLSQMARIYCAKFLKRAAMEMNVRMSEDKLKILEKCLNDPIPLIKFNVRAAFASEINKQTRQQVLPGPLGPWSSNKFSYAAELTEIIALEPVVLTLAGEKPEYFTHSINVPILKTLNHHRVQHRKSQWKVTQATKKLFGAGTRPLETLTPGWEDTFKQALKFLSKQKDPIPRSVLQAVQKVFVEQDNSSILPVCAKFISKCLERKLSAEHVTFSPQLLEQLCVRLTSSKSEDRLTYFECLHWIREWQELPDAFFHLYHLEAAAIRFLSSSRFSNENKKLVNKLQLALPGQVNVAATEGILDWIQYYLARGFVISKGITEAYRSNQALTMSVKEGLPTPIKAGLTAAARNGEVIPEDLLFRALRSFPSSNLTDEKDFVLAQACLQNQSLPDQVLYRCLSFLRKTDDRLVSRKTVEQCLTLISSAYLLNRRFAAVHKSRNVVPVSQLRQLLFVHPPGQNEEIFDTLLKKFITPQARKEGSLKESVALFLQAKEVAQRNATGVNAAESGTDEEALFQKLIAENIRQSFSKPGNSHMFQRLIPILRSSSVVRQHVKETLKPLDEVHSNDKWPLTDNATFADALPFARAAFVSMVTSSTEDAAAECSEILELICTKFCGKDRRLLYVRASIKRLQNLGVTLARLKGVDGLLNGSWDECLFSREGQKRPWNDIEDTMKQSPSLFYRPFDFIRSRLRHGNFLEELLLAAQNTEFCRTFQDTELPQDVDILLEICRNSEGFKYNCPTSFLIHSVEEYLSSNSSWCLPPQLTEDKRRDALADLVYRAVISLLVGTIRQKLPDQESTDLFKGTNQESIMVLAAELLESFYYNLPKLNFFLSKLSIVNIDTMWKILPLLYNSELDFNRLNIEGDPSHTDFEPEEIHVELETKDGHDCQQFRELYGKEPAKTDREVLSCGLKLLLRHDYSFHHFFAHWSKYKLLEQTEAFVRLAAYKMDPFNYDTVTEMRKAVREDGATFLNAVNKHIQESVVKRVDSVLSLPELVSQLVMAKGIVGTRAESELLSTLKDIVDGGDRRKIRLGPAQTKTASSLTRHHIKRWSNHIRGNGVDPAEAICVFNRAVKLWKSWDLTIEQTLAILLGLSQPKERRLLLELSTGSGKSMVTAIVAAIKALEGNKVDVFTSNHLLARRDAQEWKEFYEFFNLTCSSNGGETVTYGDGPKACYSSDIVYGDINQFQFDALRTEFLGLGTRGGRSFDYVIIDEVDSILLDDGSRLAMLSSTFSGVDKLQPIYHMIRSTLLRFDSEQNYYCLHGALYHYSGGRDPKNERDFLEEQKLFEPRRAYLKRTLEAYVRVLLGIETAAGSDSWKTAEHFQLPPHLLEYSKYQVSNWTEAAITAEALEENKDYIVVGNKVVPIDPNSGVLQESSNWTNGLHQFLQIKHQLDLTPESRTTNFLSNIAMVKKYQKGMIGLTGTLGSRESYPLMSDNFNADCIPIAQVSQSKFVEFPNLVLRKRQHWREAIVYRVKLEAGLARGVLIICETVKQAKRLHSMLARTKGISGQVKLHVRSDHWMEHHLQHIQPRDVVVTTNLGTRGMDIKTSTIEGAGGLHVILAYMPPNTRIVRQAFGRTARKGNKGTGHFIIKKKDGTLEPADVMKEVTESEMDGLKKYFQDELPSISFKDKIYADFVTEYSRTQKLVLKHRFDDEQSLEEDGRRIIRRAFRRPDEYSGESLLIMEGMQDIWAAYLKLHLDAPPEVKDQILWKDEWDNLMTALNGGWQDPKELFCTTGNCFHLARYGFQIYRKLGPSSIPLIQKCVEKAEELVPSRENQLSRAAAGYFSAALDTASSLTPAASAGISYVLLKICENLPDLGNPHVNYKLNALRQLRMATEGLEKDIGYYYDCKSLLSNPFTSPLANQLTEKIKALDAYKVALEETSRAVRLSLRPVEITAKGTDGIHVILISDGTESNLNDLREAFATKNEIELAFHGLTVNKDIDGYSYQVQAAIKFLYDKINSIEGSMDEPTVSLVVERHDISSFLSIIAAPPKPGEVSTAGSDSKSKDKSKPGKNMLQWNRFPDLVPAFELKFGLLSTLDEVQEILNALKFRDKLPSPKITFKSLDDLASDLAMDTEFYSRAVSRSKLVTQTIDGSSQSGDECQIEGGDEFTVDMADASESSRKRVFDALVKRKISFDVSLEGVHLEDEQVALSCQKYSQACSQVSILLPRVSKETHGANTSGKQKQIIEAVAHYCKAFKLQSIAPTLKIAHLDPTLANTLLCEVDRASEPMVQLELVPLKNLESAENLTVDALCQMEQQGLFLVVSFAEKYAVPKKAIKLVGCFAAVELLAGAALFPYQPAIGVALFMMALGDARKARRISQERNFSLVKYAVEKVAKVVSKGLGTAVGLLLDAHLFPELEKAKFVSDLTEAITKHVTPLTVSEVIGSTLWLSEAAPRKLFFLYYQHGGLQELTVDAIKDKLKGSPSLALTLPLLQDSAVQDLWAEFEAVVTQLVLKKDANAEIVLWLRKLEPEQIWCTEDAEEARLVEWETLKRDLKGKEGYFGQYLLNAVVDATVHNADIYCKLACVNILKGFKSHCIQMCIDVLLRFEFQPDEIDFIRDEMDKTSPSPVSQVIRILEKSDAQETIDPDRLTAAREMFRRIKRFTFCKPRESLAQKDLKNAILHYLQKGSNSLEVLHQMIFKSAPILRGSAEIKCTVVHLHGLTGPTGSARIECAGNSITDQLTRQSTWEDSVLCRLIQKVRSWPTPPVEVPEDFLMQLPTLIILLHEIKVNAMLLQLDGYQKPKKKLDGNPNVPCVVFYKLAAEPFHLESLRVVYSEEERDFTGSNLIVEAVSYIGRDLVENIRSRVDQLVNKEAGRKIYTAVHELCQTVVKNRQQAFI